MPDLIVCAIPRMRSETEYGEVSEWPNEHAWKACVPNGTAGSNPALSAIRRVRRLTCSWQAILQTVDLGVIAEYVIAANALSLPALSEVEGPKGQRSRVRRGLLDVAST
jgi:hypothetical protein